MDAICWAANTRLTGKDFACGATVLACPTIIQVDMIIANILRDYELVYQVVGSRQPHQKTIIFHVLSGLDN